LTILENELNEYRNILELTVKERSYIINDDVEALENSTIEKEKSIRRTMMHEGERRLVVEELKKRLKIRGEEPPLSVICEHLDENDSREVEKIRRDLRLTVESLDRANRENARLLVRSINFANRNMEILVRSGEKNPTYHEGGMMNENREHLKLVDRKG
jgi:flagellar biosynthesis/type III secretory pathway chaperone